MKKLIFSLYFVFLISLNSISGSMVMNSLRHAHPFTKITFIIGVIGNLVAISAKLASKHYIRLLPQDLVQKAKSAVKLMQEIKGTERINDEQKLFLHFLKNLIESRIKRSIENNSATKNDLAYLSYFSKVKYLDILGLISGAFGIWSMWTLSYIFLDKKFNLQLRDTSSNSKHDITGKKTDNFELIIGQSIGLGLAAGLILIGQEFFS